MIRPVKIILKVIAILIGIVILLWITVAIYVSTHKKQLLEMVTAKINENINGTLWVESMEPSLIRGFPGISVSLKNILLQDSLYGQHQHNLLKAEEAYIAISALSIIKAKPVIKNISINKGQIYLYTDSNGYRNTQLFKFRASQDEKPRRTINKIYLNNVQLTFDNRQKGKLYSFNVYRFSSIFNYKPDSWKAKVQVRARVNSLTFNKIKGSYVKNKLLRASLKMEYNSVSDILTVPLQQFLFDDDKINVGGRFSFGPKSSAFTLNILAPKLAYRDALSLLTPNIYTKLRGYNLEKPIRISASIKGRLKGKNIPIINIFWAVNNNTMFLGGEPVKNCSFIGSFINEVEKGKLRQDPNSAVSFYNLKGTWNQIKFSSDTVRIVNLKQPVIQGRFVSNFSLTRLNAISGMETFHINKGYANLNLLYKAPFNQNSSVEPYIHGKIYLRDGALVYTPRNLEFKNVSGIINFRGQNVLLQKMNVQSASSTLQMEGSITNFVNFYYTDPSRIYLNWSIRSAQINLGEFLTFLGKRKSVSKVRSQNRVNRLFQQLNNVLAEASVNMDLKANRLLYRRFSANKINSKVSLKKNGIDIHNVSLSHAGGALKLKGVINQGDALNKFNLNTTLSNVDVEKLFYAFENFGQDAITYRNIRGKFFADANVSGLIKENGNTVPMSFYGTVRFDLKNGALVNFEPMEKIGNFAFPNRDFSNITFSKLKNTLDIKGNKIYIPPMTIQSSVLNILIEGVYGMPTGTNIVMEIPLRNPEKDKDLPDSLRIKRIQKGIVIRLSAVDDENGQIRIKLGRQKDEVEKEKKKDKKKESGSRAKSSADTVANP